jgi:hypothetical protein
VAARGTAHDVPEGRAELARGGNEPVLVEPSGDMKVDLQAIPATGGASLVEATV